MSKMSQLHATLTEQAAELGFESIEDAQFAGYSIDYIHQELEPPLGHATVEEAVADGWDSAEWFAARDAAKEEAKAHQAFLIEKETIINKLEMLSNDTEYQVYKDTLAETIKFIKENCNGR